MGKWLGWFGGLVTVAYLGVLAYFVATSEKTFRQLELNEIGDFLGGSMGPLAFLWLVLGFFQQGIELRQNSRALQLQAEELKNSVEQQRELVKVAQEDLAESRQAHALDLQRAAQEREASDKLMQPRFSVRAGTVITKQATTKIWSLIVTNVGNDCADVRVSSEKLEPVTLRFGGVPHFRRGETQEIKLYGEAPVNIAGTLRIGFHDALGRPGESMFTVLIAGETLGIVPIADLSGRTFQVQSSKGRLEVT